MKHSTQQKVSVPKIAHIAGEKRVSQKNLRFFLYCLFFAERIQNWWIKTNIKEHVSILLETQTVNIAHISINPFSNGPSYIPFWKCYSLDKKRVARREIESMKEKMIFILSLHFRQQLYTQYYLVCAHGIYLSSYWKIRRQNRNWNAKLRYMCI